MPLSDHEQEVLKQIEAEFRRDDPESFRKLDRAGLAAFLRRRFRIGLALVAVGGILVLSVLVTNWVVAAFGFVLLTLGGVLAVNSLRKIGAGHLAELRGAGPGVPLWEELASLIGSRWARLKRRSR